MKASVILPCYNGSKYLRACLDSVLAQTMRDFELIVVDDGSTDASLAIAQSVSAEDARMRVLHQENAGVSAARNLGLAHARGEWITFVDSDDLLTPDALSLMLAHAGKEVDMVVCAHETFDETGVTQCCAPTTRQMRLGGAARRRDAALRLIQGDSLLNIMCNKLHRRALIERHGIALAPGLAVAEDALFNLEAVLCGRGIAYVPHVTYRYRTHADSAMHTQALGEWQRHLPWMIAMRQMLLRRGKLAQCYGAYVDSVLLRLYKDGGVMGVVRGFDLARPLIAADGLTGLAPGARLLAWLIDSGLYPRVYPLIWPFQVVQRKLCEAADEPGRVKEEGR